MNPTLQQQQQQAHQQWDQRMPPQQHQQQPPAQQQPLPPPCAACSLVPCRCDEVRTLNQTLQQQRQWQQQTQQQQQLPPFITEPHGYMSDKDCLKFSSICHLCRKHLVGDPSWHTDCLTHRKRLNYGWTFDACVEDNL